MAHLVTAEKGQFHDLDVTGTLTGSIGADRLNLYEAYCAHTVSDLTPTNSTVLMNTDTWYGVNGVMLETFVDPSGCWSTIAGVDSTSAGVMRYVGPDRIIVRGYATISVQSNSAATGVFGISKASGTSSVPTGWLDASLTGKIAVASSMVLQKFANSDANSTAIHFTITLEQYDCIQITAFSTVVETFDVIPFTIGVTWAPTTIAVTGTAASTNTHAT